MFVCFFGWLVVFFFTCVFVCVWGVGVWVCLFLLIASILIVHCGVCYLLPYFVLFCFTSFCLRVSFLSFLLLLYVCLFLIVCLFQNSGESIRRKKTSYVNLQMSSNECG